MIFATVLSRHRRLPAMMTGPPEVLVELPSIDGLL
jgi:hypothetical protein